MNEKLSNSELIEKCEKLTTIFDNSLAGELLSRFRTISGQGKVDLQEIITEAEKPENAGSNYTKNHMPGAWQNKRDGFINGAKWALQHTAQPAPVSVEDVMKAVEESMHPSDHINYSNLRKCLQTLFNPK